MTDHIHDWIQIPLASGNYRCECGAIGRRDKLGAIM
jgi:hypothetical protein